MATDNQKNLAASSEKYASGFDKGSLPGPPGKKYLIVTCMDARIDAERAFGVDLGDAHIIRNAGGNARDAFRSILISQHMLGTKEIILVKHTKCGMLTFKNEDAKKIINEHQGKECCPDIDFEPFGDLEGGVKADVQWLKDQPAIVEGAVISGWVYGVEDGKVKQIV